MITKSKKIIFIDVDLNDRGHAFVNNNDFENSFNSGISPSSPHSERKNGALSKADNDRFNKDTDFCSFSQMSSWYIKVSWYLVLTSHWCRNWHWLLQKSMKGLMSGQASILWRSDFLGNHSDYVDGCKTDRNLPHVAYIPSTSPSYLGMLLCLRSIVHTQVHFVR